MLATVVLLRFLDSCVMKTRYAGRMTAIIKKRKICNKKEKNLLWVIGLVLIFSHFCGDNRGEDA